MTALPEDRLYAAATEARRLLAQSRAMAERGHDERQPAIDAAWSMVTRANDCLRAARALVRESKAVRVVRQGIRKRNDPRAVVIRDLFLTGMAWREIGQRMGLSASHCQALMRQAER